MIAARARLAATYNTEETFTYYVDPSGGSDSNAGTKALPWASLQHAFANMSSNQSVGLKAGTTNRLTAAITSMPGSGIRVGCYGCLPGASNMPIISGGTLVSGWSNVTTTTTGSQVASDTFTDTAGTDLISHVPDTGGGSWVRSEGRTGTAVITAAGRVRPGSTGTAAQYAIKPTTGPTTGEYQVSADLYVASTGYPTTVLYAHDNLTSGTASYSAGISSSGNWTIYIAGGVAASVPASVTAGTTYHLDFTVSTSLLYLSVNGSVVVSTPPGTFTATNYAGLYFGATGSTPTDSNYGQFDNFTVTNLTDTATNTYMAAYSPTNAPSFVGWTSGGTTTGLTKGTSFTSLAANQWYYSGNTLYVNLGGTNPSTGTIEANAYRIIYDNTAGHDRQVFRGVRFQFGWDQCVNLTNTHGHIFDRCDWRWTAYSGVDSGAVCLVNYTNASLPNLFARITRCNMYQLMNDGGWSHAITNLQVDHNTASQIGYLAGDVASDCWQTEDPATDGFNYHSSAGLWIHHNHFDMSGTYSPKGCILYNGYGTSVDGGLIEYNTCNGGNYGVANTAANATIRYNTLSNQTTSFGGGIHVQNNTSIDSVYIYNNVVYGSNRSALIAQSGTNALTNWYVVNNTFADNGVFDLSFQAPLSGTVKNNIVWFTGSAPGTILMAYPNGGTEGTIAWDYNLVYDTGGAAYKGAASGSSSYNTYTGFPAWKSGTGYDTHSLTSDPMFNNASSHDYTLQSGSPAKGAGTAATIPAGATIWGFQIPAISIPAGGNIGAL
jgi:hypothetical protein